MTDDCCEQDEARKASRRQKCPECGNIALRVTAKPVAFLVRDASRVTGDVYYLCQTRECDTVYFDTAGTRFLRDDLTTRIGAKEEQAPHLVCYCFGHTEEEIAAELRVHGKTTIPDRVRAEIEAETCECEFRNPTGRCCLGAVTQAAKRLQRQFDTASS